MPQPRGGRERLRFEGAPGLVYEEKQRSCYEGKLEDRASKGRQRVAHTERLVPHRACPRLPFGLSGGGLTPALAPKRQAGLACAGHPAHHWKVTPTMAFGRLRNDMRSPFVRTPPERAQETAFNLL